MASRIWFITGVSSGLGRSLAEAVAARGDIAIGTLRQDAQLAAYNALAPGRTVGVKLDVNDHARVTAVVQQVITQFGRIDVLVNNAGYGLLGAVEEASAQEVERQFATNVFGLLHVTRAVLPVMRRQGSGHVVNISSVGGYAAYPGWGVYGATKFAVKGLTEALNVEWARHGIIVMDVLPLFVDTPMVEQALRDLGGESLKSMDVLGLALRPGDVAAVVWRAAHWRWWPRVHWYAGRKAYWMALARKLTPGWLNRLTARLVSGY